MSGWIAVGFIAAWSGCGVAAYRLFNAATLFRLDLKESDTRLHAVLSALGPVSLIAASLVYYIEAPRSRKEDRVVAKRRKP